ncbi:hypothetical protein [Clostridium thermarum]|uniref:hypothetical protein n=1 Tax=Clostridium thermarum TaxID=1716543 RepID=UPI0013D2F4DC|nr:hypothetical protein [Clostridium thermarum]
MNDIPILKQNVRVSLFDTSSQEETYILVLDKKRWQISSLLFNIVNLIDGKRSIREIAQELSKIYDREITEDYVESIFDKFFVKRGLLEGCEDTEAKKSGKSSYLWFRVTLIKSSMVEKFRFLSTLFAKKIFIPTLILGIILHLAAFAVYSNSISFSSFFRIAKLNNYSFFITLVVVQFWGVLLHEFGHMSASMRYGLAPGHIGGGFYFTSPVLYADVSNVWELKRHERVVVNLGGVYFQFIVFGIACLFSLLLNNNYIFISVLIGEIGMLNNFNPFLKWDGYWVVSDLLGIPNLHQTFKAYLYSRFFKLFGINIKSPIENIREVEKNFFIIYVIFCTVFTVVLTYGLFTAFYNTSSHLISSFVTLITDTKPINPATIKDFLINNASAVFIFILLLRIVYISIKGFIKGSIGFLRKLKQTKSKGNMVNV